jgi:hypothetical protein
MGSKAVTRYNGGPTWGVVSMWALTDMALDASKYLEAC